MKIRFSVVTFIQRLTYFWLIMCALIDVYDAIQKKSMVPLIGTVVYLSIAWGFWYWNRRELKRWTAKRKATTDVE